MSPAFVLFLVWLALGLVGSRLPGERRLMARMGLLLVSPLLVTVTLATQGGFPAMLATLSVPVIYWPEMQLIVRMTRALVGSRARKRQGA
jgi:hypothetical protein